VDQIKMPVEVAEAKYVPFGDSVKAVVAYRTYDERHVFKKGALCRPTPETASQEKEKDFCQCSLEMATISTLGRGC
jgi:hypothetical protein